MTETKARATIPEEVMLGRLAQSEQMRAFFIQMWQQNPSLAKQGGQKVQSLLTALECGATDELARGDSCTDKTKQRGTSLIELIMFIVIVSVALAGILLVMNVTTKGSADPLIHKQAIAAAESLLEEIQLQDFISASGVTNPVTQANRASEYHIVSDYNNFNQPAGIFSVNDAASVSAVLPGYKARVTVVPEAAAWNGIAAGSAVLVTVTVTDPQNNDIQISGYRTAR